MLRREEGKMVGWARTKLTVVFLVGVMGVLLLGPGTYKKDVSAQELVSSNGVGDLLLFPLWTMEDRDTVIAITNTSGAGGTDGLNQFVHVRFREGTASADILDFTIGLSPGDVWTAIISEGNLEILNPGSADEAVAGVGFTPSPLVGSPVSLPATFGYIEAYTMEAGGGDDVIMGHAFILNPSVGAGERLTATALIDFNATDESFSVQGDSSVANAVAREGGVDKEILTTRYNIDLPGGDSTLLLITFPTGTTSLAGVPISADPITVDVFDEDETRNFSPRSITLTQEVNVLDLATSGINLQAASGDLRQGWLRVLNNLVGEESDELNAPPVSRFPIIGGVFLTLAGSGVSVNQGYPWQWTAIRGAGGIGGNRSFNVLTSRSRPWTLPIGVGSSPIPILVNMDSSTSVGALPNFGGAP